MAHAEYHININRHINEVFNFVADGENNKKWLPFVMDVEFIGGRKDSLGAQYKQGVKGSFGRRVEGDYEVSNYQPNSLLAFQVTAGPVRPSGVFTFFSPSNGKTIIKFVLDFKPKGLAKLKNLIISRTMKKKVVCLKNLKNYLENEPTISA